MPNMHEVSLIRDLSNTTFKVRGGDGIIKRANLGDMIQPIVGTAGPITRGRTYFDIVAELTQAGGGTPHLNCTVSFTVVSSWRSAGHNTGIEVHLISEDEEILATAKHSLEGGSCFHFYRNMLTIALTPEVFRRAHTIRFTANADSMSPC